MWSEFDLAKGIWTIPASRMKGKNGRARPHSVPLTADILASSPACRASMAANICFQLRMAKAPVVVSSTVKTRGSDVRRCSKHWGASLPAWVNHDLRRTVRSRLSELRVNADVAEAILSHVKPGIRGVYDRYEHLDEKRHALELWAKRLRDIATPDVVGLVRP